MHPSNAYIIAFCSTMVRYYDYALFGLSAAILSKTFMPGLDAGAKLHYFFAVFALAVIARPVGSVIFGFIGDKISRVHAIKIANIVAMIATTLIALIPSHESIGPLSALFLFLCRILFLISLPGEIDSIKIYISEKISHHRRHLASSIVSFSAQIGVMLAAIIYHSMMNYENIYPYLWRMNFIIGGVFGVLIVLTRNYYEESKSFLKHQQSKKYKFEPNLLKVISENKKSFLLAVLIMGANGGVYNFLIIFFNTFASHVATIITVDHAEINNIILIACFAIGCILSGIIADLWQPLKQIIYSVVLSIFVLILLGYIITVHNKLVLELHMLLVFLAPFYMIPSYVKVQSIFDASVRVRMCSLAHSIGSMILSSATPFIAMTLWQYTKLHYVVLLCFFVQLLAILLPIIYIMIECYHNLFDEDNEEDELSV